jgi:hypothetical protein
MNIRAQIAEIGHPSRRARTNGDRGANSRSGIVFPVNASGFRVERIDLSELASNEYPAAYHCRLRKGKNGIRDSKGPL